MVTMIVINVTILWIIGSVAYLIAAFMKDYDVADPALFCALVWVVLIVTTVVSGMVEKQYNHYHSGIYNGIASRVA